MIQPVHLYQRKSHVLAMHELYAFISVLVYYNCRNT